MHKRQVGGQDRIFRRIDQLAQPGQEVVDHTLERGNNVLAIDLRKGIEYGRRPLRGLFWAALNIRKAFRANGLRYLLGICPVNYQPLGTRRALYGAVLERGLYSAS